MFTIERVQPEDKGEVLSFIKDTGTGSGRN